MSIPSGHQQYELTASQADFLALLRRYANSGAALPPLADISAIAGVNESTPAYMLDTLRRKGFLEYRRFKIEGRAHAMIRLNDCADWTPDPREQGQASGDAASAGSADGADTPTARMVRKSFAEFEAQEPWRRAVRAQSNMGLARYQSRHAEGELRRGAPCRLCGAAGACAHRPHGE